MSQATRQLNKNGQVITGFSRRFHRLPHPLHPAFAVGDRSFRLTPGGGGRKNHMGHLRGAGHDQILYHQLVQSLQQVHGPLHVGLGLGRILADDIDVSQLAAFHGFKHARQMPSLLRRDAGLPGALEFRAKCSVFDVLESRQLVGECTHVATPLHIVLPSQGVHT